MKIWCNVHDAEQSVPGVMCWKKEVRMIGALRRHCRFVEMQLVPADVRMVSGEAIVIELEPAGSWPDWALRVIRHFDPTRGAIPILDALADLSVSDPTEGEPPKDPWDYDP